jgi:hypothetical protein
MFGFGKKKKDDIDVPFPGEGEGKFPPPEEAFNEPQQEQAPSFPAFPSLQERPPRREEMRPIEQSSSLTGDKMEVLIAKIESLKSMIEVLNQRLISIETRLFHQERKW